MEEIKWIHQEGTVAILSDLHIGHPLSMLEEIAEAIAAASPKTLILLGDTLDFRYKVYLHEIATALRPLPLLLEQGTRLEVILGDTDAPPGWKTKLLDTLSGLHEEEARKRPALNETTTALASHLYTAYTQAQPLAILRLRNGTEIALAHGHLLADTRNPQLLARRAKEMIRWLHVDKAVLGHAHRHYADSQVTVLGTWLDTEKRREQGYREDYPSLLTIMPDGLTILSQWSPGQLLEGTLGRW